MNELGCLLSLELRALYGINRFRHTRDQKEKNRYRLLIAAMVILLGTAFFYVGGLVYGLCSLGLGRIVPSYLVVIASGLVVAFGIFTAGSRIFGQKGYELLASMPIKPKTLVLSRFLSLYVEDLVLALVVMVPGVAVYGLCLGPGLGFYLAAAVGTLFLPGIPLVAAVLVGTLVTAISARMKNKSLVQSALMVLLVVGILVGSFSLEGLAEGFDPEAFSQLAKTISQAIGRLYPPALWLGGAMAGEGVWGIGLFVLASLAAVALTAWLVAGNFHRILWGLQRQNARHDYQIGAMASRGLGKALYIRELRRYFASSIYVTNTIVGPVLGATMAVALAVTGLEPIQAALPVDVAGLLPFGVGAVFCVMTTTCTSISMEGGEIWIVKSLPIPAKAWLDSKLLLNLSLMLPFYLVALVAMIVATGPNVLQLLWQVAVPVTLMLFSAVFGITVDLKFHHFDWEKEEAVVKQSLSAGLGGFGGFLVSLLLASLVLAVPAAWADAVKGGLCLLTLGVTAILYKNNSRVLLRRL